MALLTISKLFFPECFSKQGAVIRIRTLPKGPLKSIRVTVSSQKLFPIIQLVAFLNTIKNTRSAIHNKSIPHTAHFLKFHTPIPKIIKGTIQTRNLIVNIFSTGSGQFGLVDSQITALNMASQPTAQICQGKSLYILHSGNIINEGCFLFFLNNCMSRKYC